MDNTNTGQRGQRGQRGRGNRGGSRGGGGGGGRRGSGTGRGRKGARIRGKDEWKSEQLHTMELSEKLAKLSTKREIEDLQGSIVDSNPWVEQLEYKCTGLEPWRRLPLIPRPEELSVEMPEIPCNLVRGPYQNINGYLSTHYELLREDAFAGLRRAVSLMREDPERNESNNVCIYDQVRLLGLTTTHNRGVACKFTFSTYRAAKRVSWRFSKRLMPGSLVCLSDNYFKTFRVATVAARPMSGLQEKPPQVDLIFDDDAEANLAKEFIMIEFKGAYFEAYKWVLAALQRIEDDDFQLTGPIIHLNPDIQPPAYVKANPIYNLKSIFPDDTDKESLEAVNILTDWPTERTTSLDESQMDALRTILTQRLAVVQGPPGTGKTYTSVIALHAILQNMTETDPPIVVACQTNHALDQLLRHVAKFESSIVRIGGRSTDIDEISKRNLRIISKTLKFKVRGVSIGNIRREISELECQIHDELKHLESNLMQPEAFFRHGIITYEQYDSFANGRSSDWVTYAKDDGFDTPIAEWLGDNVVRTDVIEDLLLPEEEPDAELDELREMEEDSINSEDDSNEGKLKGRFTLMKHNMEVKWPIGVRKDAVNDPKWEAVQNVWDLPEHIRASLYCCWRNETMNLITEKVRKWNKTLLSLAKDFKIAMIENDSQICMRAKLIGVTTTGLSKYRTLLASVRPKVLLIEEAAEVLEGPVAAGCFSSVEHLILVGDHMQLQGKTAEQELGAEPYHLNVSMFERLVMNNIPYVSLNTQRRMRPEIRAILTPIYGTALKDHSSVMGRDPVQGMSYNMLWYTHRNPESTPEGSSSKVNVLEAEMICGLVSHLLYNGLKAQDITILTYYSGQRTTIIRLLRRMMHFPNAPVKVATVDSYQGEENDVVILSLVRNNPGGDIGFLGNTNRLTVALSRAQRGFYIFGNTQIVTANHALWWDVAQHFNEETPPRLTNHIPITCHRHKTQLRISEPWDWQSINGGCTKPCNAIIPKCQHRCPLMCHPFSHDEPRCSFECNKPKMLCGHKCKLECWQECFCAACGMTPEQIAQHLANKLLLEGKKDETIPGPGYSAQVGTVATET